MVDDGSTDRTSEIVRSFASVRLVSHGHWGKARSVNGAAEAAAGEVLLFIDGDLVLEREYVERMVAPILAGTCVGTAHAVERVANPDNRWAACYQLKAGLPPDRRLVIGPAQVAEGSIVFRAVRASEFRRVGGFDDIGYLDDQTLCPKLGARARFVTDAGCSHYNAETLREVFAAGVWGAQSIARLHGRRALWRYQPLASLPRAVRAAVRARRASLALYDAAYEAGVCRGLLRGTGAPR